MSESQITEAILILEQTGQTFPLGQEPVTIGRKEGNTIVLAEDRHMSRRHAIIFQQADQYLIQDLGSANGTLVNDQRITDARILEHDDILSIGNTKFTVKISRVVAPEPAVPDVDTILDETAPGLEDEAKSQPSPDRDMTITSISPPPLAQIDQLPEQMPDIPTEAEAGYQVKPPTAARDLLLLREAVTNKGDYEVVDGKTGWLLLRAIQGGGGVKSILKAQFDYWIKTPDDTPLVRITGGRSLMGTKPITVRDVQNQVMGEIKQTGNPPQLAFEVFDAAHELLLTVKQLKDKFKFVSDNVQCAVVSRGQSESASPVEAGRKYTKLSISAAVPKSSFVRQLILAVTITILVKEND